MIEKATNLLLRGGKILNLATGDQIRVDLAVVNGKIEKIGIINGFQGNILDITDNLIVPGLIDMHVHLREPGREDQETITTGCAAAMAGGFTEICAMPDTEPACDKQEVVRFIKKRAEQELVNVHPIAALTKKRAGVELTEMAELQRAGAVAFSDDENSVLNSAVMRRALEYAGMYNMPVITHCEDVHLAAKGQINESIISTRLGLTPVPNAAEDVMIARDIALAQLTGGRIHIAQISTKRGVEMVKRAKQEGLQITCDVTPYHLFLTDEAMISYDTNLKVYPPLRQAVDRDALLAGIKDGTIDAITSDHSPYSIEEKDVEFVEAPFGMIGLETMLALIITHIVKKGIIPLEKAIELLSIGPRKILNLDVPVIKEGEPANLTIFNSESSFVVDAGKQYSKSHNTPFAGQTLYGRAQCVVNRELYWERKEEKK